MEYRYFKCVLDGKEFLSRAKRPECPNCGTHKVNVIEKLFSAPAKADAIEKKNEVATMPKDKDEDKQKKPVEDEDDEDDFSFE